MTEQSTASTSSDSTTGPVADSGDPLDPFPGWYPDPLQKAAERFWNGKEWTGNTKGLPPAVIEKAPAVAVESTPEPEAAFFEEKLPVTGQAEVERSQASLPDSASHGRNRIFGDDVEHRDAALKSVPSELPVEDGHIINLNPEATEAPAQSEAAAPDSVQPDQALADQALADRALADRALLDQTSTDPQLAALAPEASAAEPVLADRLRGDRRAEVESTEPKRILLANGTDSAANTEPKTTKARPSVETVAATAQYAPRNEAASGGSRWWLVGLASLAMFAIGLLVGRLVGGDSTPDTTIDEAAVVADGDGATEGTADVDGASADGGAMTDPASEQELDQLRASVESAEAEVAVAEGQVTDLEAQLLNEQEHNETLQTWFTADVRGRAEVNFNAEVQRACGAEAEPTIENTSYTRSMELQGTHTDLVNAAIECRG